MSGISRRSISRILLALILLFSGGRAVGAQAQQSLEEAFKQGTVSGTLGSYYEFSRVEAEDADYGWSTAYLTLKYETQPWHRAKFGARFFAHGELYSDHDDGVTDPFDADVESQYTLPELYLNHAFDENITITAGRWDHQKITHIDDAQSEGVYIQHRSIKDLNMVAGIMRRFAEIDYDDGEDFGRNNDAQDLDSEAAFGAGSAAYLIFLEVTYQAVNGLNLNPYIMHHDDYASVFGVDTVVEFENEETAFSYGADVNYYHVDANIAGSGNADNFMVAPFMNKDSVFWSAGYTRFSDGNALNRPSWLKENLLPVDQIATYGTADSEAVFTKVKLTIGDFWTHFIFADTNYDMTAGRGDGSQEYELQFGYKFTQNLDLNIRLFDVRFDHIDDRDYQKIETLARFNF